MAAAKCRLMCGAVWALVATEVAASSAHTIRRGTISRRARAEKSHVKMACLATYVPSQRAREKARDVPGVWSVHRKVYCQLHDKTLHADEDERHWIRNHPHSCTVNCAARHRFTCVVRFHFSREVVRVHEGRMEKAINCGVEVACQVSERSNSPTWCIRICSVSKMLLSSTISTTIWFNKSQLGCTSSEPCQHAGRLASGPSARVACSFCLPLNPCTATNTSYTTSTPLPTGPPIRKRPHKSIRGAVILSCVACLTRRRQPYQTTGLEYSSKKTCPAVPCGRLAIKFS